MAAGFLPSARGIPTSARVERNGVLFCVASYKPCNDKRTNYELAKRVRREWLCETGRSTVGTNAGGAGKEIAGEPRSAAALLPGWHKMKTTFALLMSLLVGWTHCPQASGAPVPQTVRVCQCQCCEDGDCCLDSSAPVWPTPPALPVHRGAQTDPASPPPAAFAFSRRSILAAPDSLSIPSPFLHLAAVPLYERDCRYRF